MKNIKMFIFFCLIVISFSVLAEDSYVPKLEKRPELKIKEAKISLESQAKKIAFTQYINKMKLNVLAEEGPGMTSIIKIGYNIPDFASKGDLIWEVRIMTIVAELRAILWIHPNTEKVHFIIGPWE